MSLWIVSIVIVVLLLAWSTRGGGLPRKFAERSCTGEDWIYAFPEEPIQEIRDFLSLFVQAFAFKDSERLKFKPTDEVLGIYRALYPQKWMPDALEVETLASDLGKRYGINLGDLWCDSITLGEIFAATRQVNV